jgi:histidine phosphotransferase ChpT
MPLPRASALAQGPEIEPRIERLMMASLTPLDLAALLCSRVCHDVISPVGAIINGLEVLDGEEDEEMRTVAMELIKKSAVSASARLQFCRLAFGAAGSFGALLDTGDAEKVARELFANGRTVLEWNCGRRMASRTSVKLLLNLCLIAAGAVPRGGVIAVDISGEDDALAIRVEAKGANAKLSHSAADFLTNSVPNEPVDGHSIQLYFTTLLARESHATLNVSTSPDTVTLMAAPAPRMRDVEVAAYSADGSPTA